jgi:hypothetical protein
LCSARPGPRVNAPRRGQGPRPRRSRATTPMGNQTRPSLGRVDEAQDGPAVLLEIRGGGARPALASRMGQSASRVPRRPRYCISCRSVLSRYPEPCRRRPSPGSAGPRPHRNAAEPSTSDQSTARRERRAISAKRKSSAVTTLNVTPCHRPAPDRWYRPPRRAR